MQSKNYVPGVSGWKMCADGSLEVNGTTRVKLGEPAAAEPKPFVIIDGVTYISEAEVERSKVASSKVDGFGIKLQVNANGDYVAAGCGVGIQSQFIVSADRFAVNSKSTNQILDDISRAISETELAKALRAFETTARAKADSATAARISALEARLTQFESKL